MTPFRPLCKPLKGLWEAILSLFEAKMALFPHKMPEDALKNSSKTAQNSVKTRFQASPTFKTYFWTKSLEVDFFTQMAPFSTPTAEAGPGLKRGLPGAKNRPFYR